MVSGPQLTEEVEKFAGLLRLKTREGKIEWQETAAENYYALIQDRLVVELIPDEGGIGFRVEKQSSDAVNEVIFNNWESSEAVWALYEEVKALLIAREAKRIRDAATILEKL